MPAGTKFCTSCGHALAASAAQPAAASAPQSAIPTPPQPASTPAAVTSSTTQTAAGSGATVGAQPQSSGAWQAPMAGGNPLGGLNLGNQSVQGMPGAPDGVSDMVLGAQERVQRTFDLGRSGGPLGSRQSGLVLTNERLLYRAQAGGFLGRSESCREIDVDAIRGLAFETRRGLSGPELARFVTAAIITYVFLRIYSLIAMTTTLASGMQDLANDISRGRLDSDTVEDTFAGISHIPTWHLLVWVAVVAVTLLLAMRTERASINIFAQGVDESVLSVGAANERRTGFLTALAYPLVLAFEALGVRSASGDLAAGETEKVRAAHRELGSLIASTQAKNASNHEQA